MEITGQLIDVFNKEIYPVKIISEDGIIKSIKRFEKASKHYLCPGFVDAHIHIESSMLVPSRFAAEAVKHGTLATVSDPHEIANVCGVEGINFMIQDSKNVPFEFCFGAPSCVPATNFETSGAELNSSLINQILDMEGIHYLSEMMNYPGVIFENADVLKKIELALEKGMKVDGHAPGLRGDKLKKYVKAGISTDHECFTYAEAKEKAELGLKILIREGSAAKNYEALKNIIDEFPEQIMFCSDDKHPDDLVKGHINKLAARAISDGSDFWNVIRACTLNPIDHYGLKLGLLRVGDPMDLVIINDLEQMTIDLSIYNEQIIWDGKNLGFSEPEVPTINNFYPYELIKDQFAYKPTCKEINVIEARNGELITRKLIHILQDTNDNFESDTEEDILKITVVNRYRKSPPSIAFIKNFGLKKGAIASTVAHDCHNIIAVGTSDENLSIVCNELMKQKGGISVYNEGVLKSLKLEIAGLMTRKNAKETATDYQILEAEAKKMGSKLDSPFMTLSFMALLVIPELKLSDLGLFNGEDFNFVDICKEVK